MSDYLSSESRSLKKKKMKMSCYLCLKSRSSKKKRKMSYYSSQKSRSFTKKMKVFPYLPMDIIEQILWRLPVESVVRCTSVCKTWYALIRDPSFISSHLQATNALRNDLFLLKFTRKEKCFFRLHHDNDTFDEYKKLHLPSKIDYYDGDDFYTIVGICNGLICLADDWGDSYNDIFLWNPSIHKHFILPKHDCFPSDDFYDTLLGFGFDLISDDYKVLHVFRDSNTNNLMEVWLFSLKRSSWKRVSVDPLEVCYGDIRAAFVRGALHWLGELKNGMCSHMILVLDINTEKISMMDFPETLVHFVPQISLIKYKESIAIFRPFKDLNGEDQLELWVMKEYGKNSSWTKVLRTVDKYGGLDFGAGFVDLFGVRKNGELLLEVEVEVEGKKHYMLATVDLNRHQVEQQQHQQQRQQLKHLVRLGDYAFVGSYVESLVLLDIEEEDESYLREEEIVKKGEEIIGGNDSENIV